MNVLSLFDGMSCGQIALNRAGIPYGQYFAAEIDKHAIAVTQANYPNTIQLGDVTKIDLDSLPKIDLLIFGSPCQGFSFAGKGLNFDDPRSKLFFIAADIKDALQAKNPNLWFMMENVRMEKWCERIITERLDVDPIFIDSALVSAQTRKRLYWTNIPAVGQPKDRGIYLKDILENEVTEKYYLKGKALERLLRESPAINPDKSYACSQRNNTESGSRSRTLTLIKTDIKGKPKSNQQKASAFCAGAHSGGNHSDMDLICIASTQDHAGVSTDKSPPMVAAMGEGGGHIPMIVAMRGRNIEHGRRKDFKGAPTEQRLEPNTAGKSNALTSVQKDNLVLESREVKQLNPSLESGGKQPYQQNRIYDADGIAPAHCAELSDGSVLIAEPFLRESWSRDDEKPRIYHGKSQTMSSYMGKGGDNIPYVNNIRRLTEIEVERLQTVDDGYTDHVSSSQRYKMLGNGWTVDVIVWIFLFMTGEPKNGVAQASLF